MVTRRPNDNELQVMIVCYALSRPRSNPVCVLRHIDNCIETSIKMGGETTIDEKGRHPIKKGPSHFPEKIPTEKKFNSHSIRSNQVYRWKFHRLRCLRRWRLHRDSMATTIITDNRPPPQVWWWGAQQPCSRRHCIRPCLNRRRISIGWPHLVHRQVRYTHLCFFPYLFLYLRVGMFSSRKCKRERERENRNDRIFLQSFFLLRPTPSQTNHSSVDSRAGSLNELNFRAKRWRLPCRAWHLRDRYTSLSLSFSFSFGGVFIPSSFFSFIHFIIYIYFWLLFWFVWGGLSLGATVVSPPSTGTSARHQHNNSSGGGSSSNSSSSSSSSSSSFAAALRHLAKQAGGPTTTATQSTNHSDPGTITDVFFCPTRRARHNFVDS